MTQEKRKRGRPKKVVVEPSAYVMTPELSEAIDNKIAEMPQPPRIKDVDFPSNWNDLGKTDRLKWLTANRSK